MDRRLRRELLTIACLLISASAAAQTNLITFMGPGPNQTLRLRATQIIESTVEADPAHPATLDLGRRTLHMTVSMDFTSTVGPTDNQGRYEARVICDSASMTATINGSPVPASDIKAEEMVGRTFRIRYSEHGEFRTLLLEGPVSGPSLRPFSDMLGDAFAIAMPPALSAGETVTVLGSLAVARPITDGDTHNHFSLTGKTRYTLHSIAFDGADRIAHITHVMNRTDGDFGPVPATPDHGATVSFAAHGTSEGTRDVNLDRGIVLRHEQLATTDSVSHVDETRARPGLVDNRTHSTVRLVVERIP